MLNFLTTNRELVHLQQKQRNMNSRESTGRIRLMNMLHMIMIGLCALGTIAILIVPSMTTRLIISFLLIGYTFTILSKLSSIRNLFKISLTEEQQNYRAVHKWDLQKEKVDEDKNKKTDSTFDNKTNSLQKRSREETDLNTSLDRSLERSMDIKNISMSIQRSMSSSISETRLSRLSQRGIKQFNGADLSEIFAADDTSFSDNLSKKPKGSGIVLVNNQTYLSHNTSKFLQQANRQYEKVLKQIIKKQKRYVDKKYKSMQQLMRKTVKILMADHNIIKDKLTRVGEQYFDIKIVENNKSISEELNIVTLRHAQTKKCSLYLFLYKMLLLHSNKLSVSELGFNFIKEYRWINFEPKISQIFRSLFKLTQALGVDNLLVKSQLKEYTETFVEDYRNSIQMVQLYLQNQFSQSHNPLSKETSFFTGLTKSRAFALYLIIREINASLKYAGKIKFNDSLNFRYPKEDKIQFEINKREGTQGPYIHYDLRVLDEGSQKLKYSCQPGERNYLSVLYFLLFQFSKKEELLSWNTYVKSLVSQYV